MSCRSRFEIWLRNCEWRYQSLYCSREILGLSVFVIYQKKTDPIDPCNTLSHRQTKRLKKHVPHEHRI